MKQKKKNRSPTIHRVSRTHRVDLDWFYDRINLDPMIQIKYVNTTQRLADGLTKGSFTKDIWTQLTLLVNIMTHTTFSQSNLSFSSAVVNPSFSSMSKRARDSFATSASANQKSVHCTVMIARKLARRMPTWAIKQYFHQNTKLEATPSVKICVGQIVKDSTNTTPGASRSGQVVDQALGDQLLLKNLHVKRKSVFTPIPLENNTSGSSTKLQTLSSRRARRSTNFIFKYWNIIGARFCESVVTNFHLCLSLTMRFMMLMVRSLSRSMDCCSEQWIFLITCCTRVLTGIR